MNIECITLPAFQVNAYWLQDPASGISAVLDTGFASELAEILEARTPRPDVQTIPHHPLQKTLKRYIPDRDLLRLIDLWLAEGASAQGFLSVRRGIAQGAVISPILCNLYLHELDLALADKNIPFVRFADDFLLFAPDEKKAQAAQTFM